MVAVPPLKSWFSRPLWTRLSFMTPFIIITVCIAAFFLSSGKSEKKKDAVNNKHYEEFVWLANE